MHALTQPSASRRAGSVVRRAPDARSAGFSLIEILVAVLIISVGVLGVAGLQLISLQNNTSAMFRSQAFQAAYEIIDRQRANPGESYAIALADPIPGAGAPTDCRANACSTADMRTYDLATWLCDIAYDPVLCAFDARLDNGNLPGGDAAVVIAGDQMTVTVQWQDGRNPDPLVDPTVSISVTTSL